MLYTGKTTKTTIMNRTMASMKILDVMCSWIWCVLRYWKASAVRHTNNSVKPSPNFHFRRSKKFMAVSYSFSPQRDTDTRAPKLEVFRRGAKKTEVPGHIVNERKVDAQKFPESLLNRYTLEPQRELMVLEFLLMPMVN